MKLVYVITRSDTIGGAAVHVRDVARAMLDGGHQVTVMVGGHGPYTDQLAARGIPYRSLRHLVRPVRPLRDLRGVFELRRNLLDAAPDLVSAHSSKAGILTRLAGRSLLPPVVFTAHGWSFAAGVPGHRRRLYRSVERAIAPLADRIVTVCEADRALAVEERVASPGRIVTVHNGMPEISPSLRADPGGVPPRIVVVARLSPPKDFATLFRALVTLEDLPWSVEWVGGGEQRDEAEALARSLALDGRIDFLGERDDVPECLAEGQIFVLPSRWEGFPRSVLEAMRAGLPVVASDVGGVGEAVAHGTSGYLVPRGDAAAFGRHLRALLDNPDLRRRLGAAARARYEKSFTFERMLEATLAVYDDVLEERARRSITGSPPASRRSRTPG